MANRILIKTSANTATITPDMNVLRTGELAYSYKVGDSDGGDRLFIGVGPEDALGNADYVHVIGGKYYTDMMDHTKGVLTASSAIITDANNKIDRLLVDTVTIDNDTINTTHAMKLTTDAGNIILSAAGEISADNNQIISLADPVDQQDAVNVRYLEAKEGKVAGNTGEADWKSNNQSNYLTVHGTTTGHQNISTTVTDQGGGNAKVNVDLNQNLQITSAVIGDVTVNQNVLTAVGELILQASGGGQVTIDGDLTVNGTTTTINSTEVSINDKLIVLADSAPNAAAANGAGIYIEGADASLTYTSAGDGFVFNKGITVPDIQVTSISAGTIIGVYQGFDSDFAAKTTDELSEGNSNLYYTTARFDSDFTDNNTDHLSEGSTNLYYTTARFDSDFTDNNTDQLSEGDTNLYFTQARARASHSAIDAGGDGSFTYNSSTGAFTYVGPVAHEVRSHFSAEGDLSYDINTGVFSIDIETEYTKSNFDSDLGDANTGQLPEGTNLYYTTTRFDSDFNDNTTDQLSEGAGNLYYTDERVDDRVAALLSAAEGLDVNYDDNTGVLTLSAEEATSTNLGAASFDSIDFLVTAGNVEIKTIDCGTF